MTSKQVSAMLRAAEYFRVMVEPTVREFLDRRGDVRLGSLTAIVLNQMADYWALDEGIASAKVRDRLRTECPPFAVIADVADAAKHARLTRVSRQLTDADQISSPAGLFQAPFGTGVFNEAWVAVATLDNGDKHALDDVVLRVAAMWQEKLNQHRHG